MIHNGLGQYPTLLRGYLAAVGLLENEEGVIRLGETLTPVMDIWNGRREWALQRGEFWYARRLSIAAGGAGTIAAFGIGNPLGSGICISVEKISASSAAGDQLSMYAYTNATASASWGAGGVGNGVPMDRRLRGGAGAAPVLGGQANIITGNTPVGLPAGGQEIEVQRNAVLTHVHFTALPQLLYAGDALIILNNTVATTIQGNLVWYERKCVVNEARGG